MRESHRTSTVTRHQEDNWSKATSSLLLVMMMARLERTQSNVYQSKDQHRTPKNNGMYIKQWFLHRIRCAKLVEAIVKWTKKTCSNHEIYVLLNMDFNLTKPKLSPELFAWRYTGKRWGRDWSFRRCFSSRKRCARLWRCGDVMTFEGLTLTPFCFEKSSVRKGIF